MTSMDSLIFFAGAAFGSLITALLILLMVRYYIDD